MIIYIYFLIRRFWVTIHPDSGNFILYYLIFCSIYTAFLNDKKFWVINNQQIIVNDSYNSFTEFEYFDVNCASAMHVT